MKRKSGISKYKRNEFSKVWLFIVFAVLIGLVDFFISPALSAATTTKIRVAAAADLKFAFDEITKDFKTRHPGTEIEVTYGSSGMFTKQIESGAPFDLFLSADESFAKELVEKKLTKGAEFQYASGRLVLWMNHKSPLAAVKATDAIELLKAPELRKLAVANPVHAPYGRISEEALKKANLYDALKSKLVTGENIAQTAQYAETQATDAGLIALALAESPTMKASGQYIPLTTGEASTLKQSGVVIASTKVGPQVEELRAALLSPAGQKILKQFGLEKE